MKSIVLNMLEYGKQLSFISSSSHLKDVFSNNACQDHAIEEETVQIYHASVISICLELGLGFRRQSVIIFGYLGLFFSGRPPPLCPGNRPPFATTNKLWIHSPSLVTIGCKLFSSL